MQQGAIERPKELFYGGKGRREGRKGKKEAEKGKKGELETGRRALARPSCSLGEGP